jgi:hypothetical protein
MAKSLEVKMNLPEELVDEARELNLLTDDVIAHLLREEVDRRVNEIVNQEIHDYRREKHAKSTQ